VAADMIVRGVRTGADVAAVTGCSERTGRRIARRVAAALELAGVPLLMDVPVTAAKEGGLHSGRAAIAVAARPGAVTPVAAGV